MFNIIAPIYGLFYNHQKSRFAKVIAGVRSQLDLTAYKTILDVGCGTGALCTVLNAMGLSVTGMDPAEKMLNIAKKKLKGEPVQILQASILDPLPFGDKSFDLSIASYVAHGLQKSDRKRMYIEMSRVTKEYVIIYDYNKNRSWLTSVIEWLERGDYFRFINEAESEMKSCLAEMTECFSSVEVVNVDVRAAWYICTPK